MTAYQILVSQLTVFPITALSIFSVSQLPVFSDSFRSSVQHRLYSSNTSLSVFTELQINCISAYGYNQLSVIQFFAVYPFAVFQSFLRYSVTVAQLQFPAIITVFRLTVFLPYSVYQINQISVFQLFRPSSSVSVFGLLYPGFI